jgi:hypothetical protein
MDYTKMCRICVSSKHTLFYFILYILYLRDTSLTTSIFFRFFKLKIIISTQKTGSLVLPNQNYEHNNIFEHNSQDLARRITISLSRCGGSTYQTQSDITELRGCSQGRHEEKKQQSRCLELGLYVWNLSSENLYLKHVKKILENIQHYILLEQNSCILGSANGKLRFNP